jgi:hypothetical protein
MKVNVLAADISERSRFEQCSTILSYTGMAALEADELDEEGEAESLAHGGAPLAAALEDDELDAEDKGGVGS